MIQTQQQYPQPNQRPHPADLLRVPQQDLNKHVRGKRDLWSILAVAGQFYMPPYDDITVHFMREVIAGRKFLIKLKDLVPVTVPHMNDFNADRLYKQAMEDEQAQRYLPDATNDARRPCSRKFLFDVSQI